MSATEYWIESDERQWHLKKEADAVSRGECPTIIRRESTVGYYPKFGQALTAMYERMVADGLKVVGCENIGASIALAVELAERLRSVEIGERVIA